MPSSDDSGQMYAIKNVCAPSPILILLWLLKCIARKKCTKTIILETSDLILNHLTYAAFILLLTDIRLWNESIVNRFMEFQNIRLKGMLETIYCLVQPPSFQIWKLRPRGCLICHKISSICLSLVPDRLHSKILPCL